MREECLNIVCLGIRFGHVSVRREGSKEGERRDGGGINDYWEGDDDKKSINDLKMSYPSHGDIINLL